MDPRDASASKKGPSDCSEKIYMCACKVVLIVNERNDDDKSK